MDKSRLFGGSSFEKIYLHSCSPPLKFNLSSSSPSGPKCKYSCSRSSLSLVLQWPLRSTWGKDRIMVKFCSCNTPIILLLNNCVLKSSSASLAGINVPTDPAVILALGPVASKLAAALPTSPVLAVLETAAPTAFLSQIVHDQTFANSFESAFAAGSSPSWFTALPTEVKGYLHSYSGFGGLATVAGGIDSALPKATSAATTVGSGTQATSSAGDVTTSNSRSSATSSTSALSASAASSDATSGSTASGTAAAKSSASSASPTTGGVGRPNRATALKFSGVLGILAVVIML